MGQIRNKKKDCGQLEVLFRDERLLAVSKSAGMLVHRGWDNDPVTVADLVRDELVGKPVHAVHRLDRATSGVLLFALDAETARYMQTEFQSGRVLKRYLALVRGPMRDAFVLDHPVPRKDGGQRIAAVTEFEPVAHKHRWSLVVARPRTGRLHQIRRHLKHLSHPVIGDTRYGKGPINRFFREAYGLNRLALHACSLRFTHPDGKELVLEASLPEDLSGPLIKLGISCW